MHVEQFQRVIQDLNKIKNINKNIDYKLGYSNFSFDLWMILHKNQQKGAVTHRKQYVKGINTAYGEKFQFIDDYKEERNFKRILTKINLDNVITAVKNGNEIRKMNEENAEGKGRICGKFKYYIDNPDMTINECVELILKECGAIK